MSFEVVFNGTASCNTINEFSEGIVVSYRLLSDPLEWIPLKFIYHRNHGNHGNITIGDKNNFTLRGYAVPIRHVKFQTGKASYWNIKIAVCGFDADDSIQFRWLQTSYFHRSETIAKDKWILNNVNIHGVTKEYLYISLLNDTSELE